MKKFIVFTLALSFVMTLNAQKIVTKFLGIPVDGSKTEMLSKLKAKGFRSNPYNRDVLTGEFNGRDVIIGVVTNNNKVYRVAVEDVNTDNEAGIRIRFNNLCRQFMKNKRYVALQDYTIPDGEKIGTNMSLYNKRYEAAFCQIPDSVALAQYAQSYLKSKYTDEQLSSMSEEDSQKEGHVHYIESLEKRIVWFMIGETYGKYKIVMFYDNGYNQANGEDL